MKRVEVASVCCCELCVECGIELSFFKALVMTRFVSSSLLVEVFASSSPPKNDFFRLCVLPLGETRRYWSLSNITMLVDDTPVAREYPFEWWFFVVFGDFPRR